MLDSRRKETVSEPPSPQQAYFDKYPKRAEQQNKHVTIEFPTIPERKPSTSRHGLRDWRVVQAHLEPKAAPRPRRKDGKIRDPDDMVIVSHAEGSRHTVPPSPSMSGFRSSLISSAGTSEPGALTPPRTPTSPHEPVVIASSSVEAMDALIDSMGAGASLDSMSFLSPATYKRNSRFGYPLYQPPLPTPPEGVKLGVDSEWKSRLPRPSPKRERERERWRYDEDPTRDSSSSFGSAPSRTGTPSTAASSRTGTPAPASRGSTPAPSSAPGSSASTPTPGTQPTWLQDDPFIAKKPARIKSDEEIEADERADVTSPLVPPRARQRSGVSVRTAKSLRSVSGRTISTSSTSSVHKARGMTRSPGVWDLAETASIRERAVVPSIDDIIRLHAPAVEAATKAASQRGSSTVASSSASTAGTPKIAPSGHSRAVSLELDLARSSVDSIADEAQRALQVVQPPVETVSPRRPSTAGSYIPRLQHARSFPKSVHSRDTKSVYSDGHRDTYAQSTYSHDAKSLYSRDVYDTQSLSPHFRPFSDGASICSGNSGNTVLPRPDPRTDNSLEMAQYLRSPRLTRLLTLRRPAHAGLTVSLADVGSLTGRPVIIYLGLGCVRYLVALYDEMAEALNLRLICVDRWGLGRTSDVPTDKRGLLEWAGVVEEVADTLGLTRYSVLAHSAGAPYALAGALKAGERVFGSVHLLAPWVSMAVDGGYKWLKYVPNGLIKTAQAAEWRLQGWMIGKPPTIQYEGIGFDASAPTAAEPRPSFSSFSEYDELDDFQGRFSGGTEEERREKEREKEREEKGKGKEREDKGKGKEREGKGKEREKDERPRVKEDKTKGKNKEVSEMGERPRKGSKSIFGGLFNNSLPKNSSKRGMSTPPSSFVKPGDGSKDVDDSKLDAEVEGADAEPVTPTADSPTTPTPAPPPVPVSVPATPTHPRQPKLKGLRSMSSLKSQAKSEPAKRANVGLGLGEDEDHKARTHAWASDFGDESRPAQRRSLSLNNRPLPTSPAPPSPRSPNPPKTVTLASALLQASHAESLKGGTADLLSILERDSKPWGFSYADVRQPVRVWYGDRDDKIGVGSVRWMERVMKSCEVKIVKGAGHSLMTHAEVVVEVLESIAREWDERS